MHNNPLLSRAVGQILKQICFCCFIVLLPILCLLGCGAERHEVAFISDAVFADSVNIEGSKCLFCFNYLYKGSKPELKVISVNGLQNNEYAFSFCDVTDEFMNQFSWNGYRIGSGCIEIEESLSAGDSFLISDVEIEMDNKTIKWQLQEPLEYSALDIATNTNSIGPVQIASVIGIDGNEITFVYEAEEDLSVTGFSLGKYLEFENVAIYTAVNSQSDFIACDNTFPIDLQKGNVIMLKGVVKSDYYTGYQNIYTTSVLKYQVNQNIHEQHHSLAVIGITEESDFDQIIRNALEKKQH